MSSKYELLRAGAIVALLVLMTACTTTTTRGFQATEADVDRPRPGARILLMPPDVEMAEVTMAGLEEPRADWTAAAARNLRAALESELELRDAGLVEYRSPEGIALIRREHVQLVKLHAAVGNMILWHKYDQSGMHKLPTKRDRFDWTIGRGAAALQEDHDADYALFVYFRDRQASSERVAMQAVGALFGVGVSGGYEVGFVSLVNLDDGDVVWFNVLTGTGRDMRKAADAEAAVRHLLEEIPITGTSGAVTQQRIQEQQAGRQQDDAGQNLTDCPTGRGPGC